MESQELLHSENPEIHNNEVSPKVFQETQIVIENAAPASEVEPEIAEPVTEPQPEVSAEEPVAEEQPMAEEPAETPEQNEQPKAEESEKPEETPEQEEAEYADFDLEKCVVELEKLVEDLNFNIIKQRVEGEVQSFCARWRNINIIKQRVGLIRSEVLEFLRERRRARQAEFEAAKAAWAAAAELSEGQEAPAMPEFNNEPDELEKRFNTAFQTFKDNMVAFSEEIKSIKFVNGYARVKFNDRWGLINECGEFIIKPQYEDIVRQDEGVFRVKVNGKWGLINDQEEFIHEPQFDAIGCVVRRNGLICLISITIGDKIGFINKDWKFVVEPQFDYVHPVRYFSDLIFMIVDSGGLKGLIDPCTGQIVVEPQFDFIDDEFDKGGFVRFSKNGKWGLLSTSGRIAVEPICDEIERFDDYNKVISVVRISNNWGVIDIRGDFVLEPQAQPVSVGSHGSHSIFWTFPQYTYLKIGDKKGFYIKEAGCIFDEIRINTDCFSNGWTIVTLNHKLGFLDKDGHIVIDPQFEDAGFFYYQYAKVKNNNKWGLIDETGKFVFEPQFDSIIDNPYPYELIRVAIGDKIGFLNIDEHLIIQPQFEETSYFCWPMSKVKKNAKWGVINEQGEYLVKPQFDEIKIAKTESASSGDIIFAWVMDNTKWGLIKIKNNTFSIVVDCVFDDVSCFNCHSGLVAVRMGYKWGYINFDGCFIVEPQFDEVNDFDHLGLAAVKIGNKWGYINHCGLIIVEPKFDEVGDFSPNSKLAAVRIGDKWGYIFPDGHFFVEPKFDYVEKFDSWLAHVKLDGVNCCIDRLGRVKDYEYYLRNNKKTTFYRGSYYNSAQDGWDTIAGDAGFDSEDYDIDGLREYLGID